MFFSQYSKLFSNRLQSQTIFQNFLVNRFMSSIEIGSTARLSKTFTEEDVQIFGKLSGDFNPLHFDKDYCSKTKFGKPLVHGTLTNGLVSAVLGTVLPGPGTVFVEQTINFTKPLYIGEEVTAEVTVVDIKKRFIDCKFVCFTPEGKEVVSGTAKVVML